MDDVAQCLCRTLRVYTAQGSLILQVHYRRTAGGADRRHGVGFNPLCMMGDPDDLRDNIACLAHLNGVPDAQPNCRMKSSLWRVARATVVPARNTGSKQAVGVKHAGAPQQPLRCCAGWSP